MPTHVLAAAAAACHYLIKDLHLVYSYSKQSTLYYMHYRLLMSIHNTHDQTAMLYAAVV